MPETTTSRADMVRSVNDRLSVVASDRASRLPRATRARELSRRLADTLDHVELAIGQRRLAEKQLDDARAAGNNAAAEVRAALARARQTERDADHALSQALQSACDALAAWKSR